MKKEELSKISLLDNIKYQTIEDKALSPNTVLENYTWNEFSLDAFLLLIAAWAQFGSSFFFQETAFRSVNDPLERYLYPSISTKEAENTRYSIGLIIQVLSFIDAICTVGTYVNMKKCRYDFINGMKKGMSDYRNGKISSINFFINTFLIFSTFIIGSFLPWIGLQSKDYSDSIKKVFSITMMVGLLISYVMSNAPYIFSTTKHLDDFSKLSYESKKEILNNIFFTKNGIFGFFPRAFVNSVNRSWSFYGVAQLIENNIFYTNKWYICYPFTILSAVSAGYQTIMSQGINDYKSTFFEEGSKKNSLVSNTNNFQQTSFQKRTQEFISIFLSILIAGVFVLRTLSVPSLYTGEIEDPEKNYSTKDAVIASIGLLFGGYAAFQYSRFRHTRWQDNFSVFFHSSEKPQIQNDVNSPLINQDDSHKIVDDEETSISNSRK